MLISDWSSDVCSSDLIRLLENYSYQPLLIAALADDNAGQHGGSPPPALLVRLNRLALKQRNFVFERLRDLQRLQPIFWHTRSEEHTSELQSLMRISYSVFCLTKKIHNNHPFRPHSIPFYLSQ